jgi:ATPase family protein associated with various cellular activities (AAA)
MARDSALDFHLTIGLRHEFWDLADLALKSRFVRALEEGTARYAIHRSLRFAARVDLEELFDDLALNLGWSAQRLGSGTMILDAKGLFISAHGGRKDDYCSCYFGIWAETPERAGEAREAILSRVGSARIREPMFSIDWHFLTSKHELQSASIEEMADDVVHDEAYPSIEGGVGSFIRRYLEAPETVLVLQGPPGTGKTRLIRAILGEMSRRKNGDAQALYTSDKKTLESDEIFVKFITGWDDAFVVEDADHLLKPRAEGNENLHRFLSIADGVVRAQGRKIVFSTNLPNIGDLDDALIRPGRCFARLSTRELSVDEAGRLFARLAAGVGRSGQAFPAAGTKKSYSLADVYQAFGHG